MSLVKEYFVWLDDERDINWSRVPKNIDVIHVKTYHEAIEIISYSINNNINLIIDFDHDLGCKRTGYDVAKWIIASDYHNIKFKVHSINPVGVKNIREVLLHYGYEEIK